MCDCDTAATWTPGHAWTAIGAPAPTVAVRAFERRKRWLMRDVVVVEAVRSPVGRRKGGLSGMHAADLLGEVQRAVVERSGIDPAEIGQVVGGCVGQVGMQAANITRTAWLQAGLPLEAGATTVNTQCGSSQQATNMATGLIAAGVVDVAVACGVEVMSVVAMGSTVPEGPVRWQADQPHVLGALRAHLPVRGRGTHRGDVRRHPRRPRPVRQAVPGPRRGRVGRGSLRHPDRADRRAHTRRGRRAHRHPHGRSATKGCATPRWRRSPTSSRCSIGIPRFTPRAPRRRSATAPARCCS